MFFGEPKTMIQLNVLYLHLWFHEESLASMKHFHCTKGSLYVKNKTNKKNRFFRLLKCSSHFTQVLLNTVHWKVFWGSQNGSSMASLQKPVLIPLICVCRDKSISTLKKHKLTFLQVGNWSLMWEMMHPLWLVPKLPSPLALCSLTTRRSCQMDKLFGQKTAQ